MQSNFREKQCGQLPGRLARPNIRGNASYAMRRLTEGGVHTLNLCLGPCNADTSWEAKVSLCMEQSIRATFRQTCFSLNSAMLHFLQRLLLVKPSELRQPSSSNHAKRIAKASCYSMRPSYLSRFYFLPQVSLALNLLLSEST